MPSASPSMRAAQGPARNADPLTSGADFRARLYPRPWGGNPGSCWLVSARVGRVGDDSMSRWEFKLPDIGEGVAEGEIVGWLVQAGDAVVEDQPVVEMMTDKATVTITR